MMHGYLAFDEDGELLIPFRTWRNTSTSEAATLLTETLGMNIPMRWSVAHLLQAAMDGEGHVGRIARLTTLAGYVHHRLSGRHALGIGDASGMFPIAPETQDYDAEMLATVEALPQLSGIESLRALLPDVLVAGQEGGRLTEEGARLLDTTGSLRSGALMAPPEGDAGTGMVATDAIAPRTGNVSAGTSAFAMIVLEEPLRKVHREVDLVATPTGRPVAMIHTNNCTGDLDQWLRIFADFARATGSPMEDDQLYRTLFTQGAAGDVDAGGIVSFNYLSGEHQVDVESGRPLLVRQQDAHLTLANFMRAQLYGAFGALASGMQVLLEKENVPLDALHGHGGIFRTQGVAQQILADALDTPVAVSTSAGEGGAWGMAILAGYAARSCADGARSGSLEEHLEDRIFAQADLTWKRPDPEGRRGFATWLGTYREALPIERLAGRTLP